VSVENNCHASETECSTNGALVVPTLQTYDNPNGIDILYGLQFKGLTKNTRTVIRIDLTLNWNLDCGCTCKVSPGNTACQCPETVTPRKTHLSSSQKRSQQGKIFDPTHKRDNSQELGFDEFTVALYVNDYYVKNKYYSFPIQYMRFENRTLCRVVSCTDYTGCYTGTPTAKIDTYKDRGCDFVQVSCDDGDDETYDRCIPPIKPYKTPNMPPICIHTGWDEIQDSYCYYGNGFDCQDSCTGSNDTCVKDKFTGWCFESSACSVDALQQENLEAATSSKQLSVGSLSPLQVFGIIGGCIGFVVLVAVVIFVVVIYKKFFQDKSIHQDTIVSLQVPLN